MTPGIAGEPVVVEEGPDEMLIFALALQRAVDHARSRWGVEERDVRVVTVREPRVGWLGLGRREGLFRVLRLSSYNEERSLKDQMWQSLADPSVPNGKEVLELLNEAGQAAPSDSGDGGGDGSEVARTAYGPQASALLPGQARVRDGRLEVRGNAIVIAPDRIALHVNGQRRQGTTMIRETDEVRVEPSVSPAAEGFTVSVTPDEMAATLEIHGTRLLRLRDASPGRPLLLEVEEVSLPPGGLSEEAVREQLAEIGVTYGIDPDAIRRAVQEMSSTPVVVAKGDPVQPGRPAYAEFSFEKKLRRRVVIRDDQSVDYRGELDVPFAEQGDLLARKVLGEAGQPGRTVRDRELPAPQAEVVLLAGLGAHLDEEGFAVRAAVAGRPQVEESTPGRYLIRVVPVLRHGTVDLSSGNLKFAGDIIIQGNVEESMSVVAGGDVTVYGTVSKAYVEAGGHLTVRGNSFNSTLVAGGSAAFFSAEQLLLERVVATLDRLQHAIEQVQSHANVGQLMLDETRFRMLVRLLVQAHMQDLPELLGVLNIRLSAHDRREALSEGLRTLVGRHISSQEGVSFKDQTEIEALRTMLLEAIALARAAPRDRADATLRYVHNCRVEALGNIRVSGEGSYYSDFHAGKRFRSLGPVRGGRVVAHDGVDVSEAGSDMGVTTELVTSETGAIRLGRVFPGVILRAGRRARKIEDMSQGVVYRFSQDRLKPRDLGRFPAV